MTAFTTGHTLGKAICELMGVDPAVTLKVDVHCQANQYAEVVFTLSVLEEQGEKLARMIAEYHWGADESIVRAD